MLGIANSTCSAALRCPSDVFFDEHPTCDRNEALQAGLGRSEQYLWLKTLSSGALVVHQAAIGRVPSPLVYACHLLATAGSLDLNLHGHHSELWCRQKVSGASKTRGQVFKPVGPDFLRG
jgi:hypothetical protein